MIDVMKTVLPVIATLAIGALVRKFGLVSREGIGGLKRVVMDVTLPAVLLGAFAGAEYTLNSILLPIIMFLVCLSALGLGIWGKKAFKIDSPFAPYLTTGYEAGMLGYALFTMLYGSGHTASFALLDLGQVLFVFTVYKASLCRVAGGRQTARETVRNLATSPTIWAIVAGVALGATGLYKSMAVWRGDELIDSIAGFIAAPTGAVILITIGYDLTIDISGIKSSLKTVGLRLAVCLVLMLAMLGVTAIMFPGDIYIRGAVLLMFMLPPPYVLPIIADDPAQREYVSATLCIVTLVTIIAFTVMAAL